MRHDLRDLENSMCGNCHGEGVVPDLRFDEGHRYERCDVCGGTGMLRAVA